jgi:malonyl-CoA decarboxylase
LRREQPNLKQFSTLSPIPGFMGWLKQSLKENELDFKGAEQKKLKAVIGKIPTLGILSEQLSSIKWAKDEPLAEALQTVLKRFAAIYLLQAKGRDSVHALDPVAYFHLSNGASIQQLNWMADTSGKGLRESCGLMINYHYRLDRIERHHEKYSGSGKITVSSTVSGLLK